MAEPERFLACIMFHLCIVTIRNLVPLHNFGAFKFLISISEAPIFQSSFCGRIPDGYKEFKNSIGLSLASSWSVRLDFEFGLVITLKILLDQIVPVSKKSLPIILSPWIAVIWWFFWDYECLNRLLIIKCTKKCV